MNTCRITWCIFLRFCKFYNLIKLGGSSCSNSALPDLSARWGRCFTMESSSFLTFSIESFSTWGIGRGTATGCSGCSSISFISWTNSSNPSRNSFWLTALTLFSRIEENDLGIHIIWILENTITMHRVIIRQPCQDAMKDSLITDVLTTGTGGDSSSVRQRYSKCVGLNRQKAK